jgi:hypothetical protein
MEAGVELAEKVLELGEVVKSNFNVLEGMMKVITTTC